MNRRCTNTEELIIKQQLQISQLETKLDAAINKRKDRHVRKVNSLMKQIGILNQRSINAEETMLAAREDLRAEACLLNAKLVIRVEELEVNEKTNKENARDFELLQSKAAKWR